jgi:hypothetical protein
MPAVAHIEELAILIDRRDDPGSSFDNCTESAPPNDHPNAPTRVRSSRPWNGPGSRFIAST